MDSPKTIPILVNTLTSDENSTSDEMGLFGAKIASLASEITEVPTEILKENLSSLSKSLVESLDDIKEVGQFQLKEVTLQVEISANGGVNLIGAANLGGKSAMTLKFIK